jgi:hypothetical protein
MKKRTLGNSHLVLVDLPQFSRNSMGIEVPRGCHE